MRTASGGKKATTPARPGGAPSWPRTHMARFDARRSTLDARRSTLRIILRSILPSILRISPEHHQAQSREPRTAQTDARAVEQKDIVLVSVSAQVELDKLHFVHHRKGSVLTTTQRDVKSPLLNKTGPLAARGGCVPEGVPARGLSAARRSRAAPGFRPEGAGRIRGGRRVFLPGHRRPHAPDPQPWLRVAGWRRSAAALPKGAAMHASATHSCGRRPRHADGVCRLRRVRRHADAVERGRERRQGAVAR